MIPHPEVSQSMFEVHDFCFEDFGCFDFFALSAKCRTDKGVVSSDDVMVGKNVLDLSKFKSDFSSLT